MYFSLIIYQFLSALSPGKSFLLSFLSFSLCNFSENFPEELNKCRFWSARWRSNNQYINSVKGWKSAKWNHVKRYSTKWSHFRILTFRPEEEYKVVKALTNRNKTPLKTKVGYKVGIVNTKSTTNKINLTVCSWEAVSENFSGYHPTANKKCIFLPTIHI